MGPPVRTARCLFFAVVARSRSLNSRSDGIHRRVLSFDAKKECDPGSKRSRRQRSASKFRKATDERSCDKGCGDTNEGAVSPKFPSTRGANSLCCVESDEARAGSEG